MKQLLEPLVDSIERNSNNKLNEEATKTSFILPLIQILGYDIFNPNIVKPEFTADLRGKFGEKVDYAVFNPKTQHKDSEVLFLIEAKKDGTKLSAHKLQLQRYFSVTHTKLAILTNGVDYWFFTDLVRENVMDSKPFLILNLLDLNGEDLYNLSLFKSNQFNLQNITNIAESKRYIIDIKDYIVDNIKDPSPAFIKFLASQITDKRLNKKLLNEFEAYSRIAFSELFDTNKSNSKESNVNENLKPLSDIDLQTNAVDTTTSPTLFEEDHLSKKNENIKRLYLKFRSEFIDFFKIYSGVDISIFGRTILYKTINGENIINCLLQNDVIKIGININIDSSSSLYHKNNSNLTGLVGDHYTIIKCEEDIHIVINDLKKLIA